MTKAIVRNARRLTRAAALSLAGAAVGLHLLAGSGPAMAATEEEQIALQLADLLRAARAVISAGACESSDISPHMSPGWKLPITRSPAWSR